MTASMTAFCRNESQSELGNIIWEIKTVNHRYLDINLKVPDEFRASEGLFREAIQATLQRGRVEVILKHSNSNASSSADIHAGTVQQLLHHQNTIAALAPSANPLSIRDILNWPGVIIEAPIDKSNLQKSAVELLKTTLQSLSQDRLREGKALAQTILERCQQCHAIVDQIITNKPALEEKIQTRFNEKIAQITQQIDQQRLHQELAILLTKADINEELDRLKTHLNEVVSTLDTDQPVGRRLDFLMQELTREANTLGAKSTDTQLTHGAMELKVLIDQMREQVQNIE